MEKETRAPHCPWGAWTVTRLGCRGPVAPATGSIGAVRTPEDDCPERYECRTEDIVQMDAVLSREDEEDPIKAIGDESDYRRADEDGHHCEESPQGAAQPMRFLERDPGS